MRCASSRDRCVAALGATFDDQKAALLVVVTDDARERGVRADEVVRELAAVAGGRGGGKPHMAQAGIPDGGRLPDALAALERVLREQLARVVNVRDWLAHREPSPPRVLRERVEALALAVPEQGDPAATLIAAAEARARPARARRRRTTARPRSTCWRWMRSSRTRSSTPPRTPDEHPGALGPRHVATLGGGGAVIDLHTHLLPGRRRRLA